MVVVVEAAIKHHHLLQLRETRCERPHWQDCPLNPNNKTLPNQHLLLEKREEDHQELEDGGGGDRFEYDK